MKVAVTGASGLVGSALVPALREAGHDVVTLVRRAPASESEIAWDPGAGTIDAARLEGVDAVIHLAGENIGQRWSAGARDRILRSRVDGTGLVARTIAGLDPRPSVLVHASGVGYYGNGDEPVTEGSPKGPGFAADVVAAWEQAAAPARDAGIRVVALRQAPIVAREGGPVGSDPAAVPARSRRPDRERQAVVELGLARRRRARLPLRPRRPTSSGRSTSWQGAVTNAEYVKAIGRAIHRPTVIPLPAVAVRLAFGEHGRRR